ncbi:MAG: InlB B-repeat-containing protein [Treponema sp.]|nr:InlB B-repeat-containing protein [Treponema sp.]
MTEGSDDLIMKALILSRKDAGIGAVVKVSVGEVSRKALPSVQSAEEFESFSLTGTKKVDGESNGRSGADIERTWTTDGEGNASSKMSAESIEVTAGAEYSFVLEAKKGGATYRGTAEKKMETGVNSLSFTLSLSGLSGEGKGSLSVTLSVPGAVKAVEAVLTAEDGSGTASTADAGIAFADGKATYTASEVASGNYVLTFILYADEAKTLKIGEWREYAGITDALTSSSSPAIESAEGLENIYSITLNTNGGTLIGTAPGSYTKYSSTITLPDESRISREGYKFLGWYDAATGGNKVESIAQGSTGEKVLYARWTTVEYTITYVLQEGITNPNPGSYTVETANITLQNVSREGYKFLGWYDAETGGNKVESIAQGSTGEKKLWAHWEILTFTVTISVNDQITETRTVEYGQTTAQPAAPAVDGYVFKDWVTDEGAFDFSTQIKKDTDIKARLLKKLELKSGPEINSMLLDNLSGGSAKKFAKSSEKKDSQYYLDNNQKIPVWYEQESETIWYYLEPDSIMTLAQNSSRMFAHCNIEAIETCDFDTSKVTNMSSMFFFCCNLTSLDVSKFDTSKVTDMSEMFFNCSNLTTIYAAAGTDWGSIENINSSDMFIYCDSLKGGNNTVYDESKTDKTYARIDGLDGKPGYFTVKPASATE